ncbi:Transketolase, thiamine diphosphate binding domain-containing protein [Aspergillus unguis]
MAPSLELLQPIQPLPAKAANGNGSAHVEFADQAQHQRVLNVFRAFVADVCQQYGEGHVGSPLGMAAIGIALWKYAMKYSPLNTNYFNRDRFVLSNGHACIWQYLFMHLVGMPKMTLGQLKSYHSTDPNSLCPGHPEIEIDGIEATTGPLGQGVANAVGLAMASKNLAATYNKPGLEVVNNMTWCMVGDACLQEGVGLEALSLAGHWNLNNLCVIFDNNNVTCDGTADVANTEDINMKMRAQGYRVVDVYNGDSDIAAVLDALLEARSSDKPTFLNVRTVIGCGALKAGSADVHGAALGIEEVARLKKSFELNPEEHFHIPQDVYDFFSDIPGRGKHHEAHWKAVVDKHRQEFPELGAEFALRVAGQFPQDWTKCIPRKEDNPVKATASRKSAGVITNNLGANISSVLVGCADLTPSCNVTFKNSVDFQSPDLQTVCGLKGDYSGRYVHFGIREHAMCSISNGLSAFNKGTFLPMTSTYFVFHLYAAAGIRMAALQGLQQIHIATHDSIGVGENGPTHQPVAVAALWRAMPNVLYIRPCDAEEVAGAYIAALQATETPTIISLSRQNLNQYPAHSSREGTLRGGYVFADESDFDVTLIGVGGEMGFAMDTRALLKAQGIKARVLSFPCTRLFEMQSREYKQSVLQPRAGRPTVAIEAYPSNGWERYADASVSMNSFGKSLPSKETYEHFGFDPKKIAPKVKALVEEVRRDGIQVLRGDFREFNAGLRIGVGH